MARTMDAFSRPARVALATVVAVCAVTASSWAAPPPFDPPRPREATLDNGLRVVVFEDARLPIARLQLFVPVGLGAEEENQGSLAHLTGQMLRRGTASRDAAGVARDMAVLGAEMTVSTLRDYSVVGAEFMAGDLEPGLAIVADAVLHPLFAPEEIGRMRFETTRALIDLHQNAATTAEEQIWLLAFDGHAYGRPPAGTVESILSRTREELKAFHARFYRPGGSVLTVAGDVKAEDVFEMARVTFNAWQGSSPSIPSAMIGPGSHRPRIRIIDLPTGGHSELRVASGAPERGSPSFVPFMIASSVFSDIAGSRMESRGRWPGTAGNAASGYAALRDAGLFTLRATVRTDSTAMTVDAMRAALSGFAARPPDEREIAAAVALQRASWPMGLTTLAGLLSTWGDADHYGLANEAMRGFAAGLDTLDAAGVAGVVRHWIDPARLSILAVGPAEALKAQLEPYGEVEIVTLDDSPQAPWASGEPTEETLRRGRERVDQSVKAHGGIAELRDVKDSSIDASIVINTQGREVTGRLRQVRKEPFRFREIMSVFVYESEQVLVDTYGWVYESQGERVEQASEDQVAAMRSNFLSDVPHLLLQAMEPDAIAIDRGQEEIQGRTTNVVEIRLQSEEKHLWLLFDDETHELVASDVRGGIPPRVLARRIFSDFRKVQNLRLPHAEERFVQNVQLMRVQVNEIGYNIGIADELFTAPIARN